MAFKERVDLGLPAWTAGVVAEVEEADGGGDEADEGENKTMMTMLGRERC